MKRLSLILLLAVFLPFLVLCAADDTYQTGATVTPLLKTQVDAAGQKIVYSSVKTPEVSCVLVTLPVGAQTGWHIHPNPCFAYVTEGEVSVEYGNGSKKVIKAGEAFAEAVNLPHNGTSTGKVPVKIVLFSAGGDEMPISVKVSR